MYIFMVYVLLALSGLTLAKLDMSRICLNNNLGDVIHNPENCNSYIVCEITPTLHYCENNLHFDPVRKVCNWPEYAGCTLGSLPSQPEEETIPPAPSTYTSMIAIDIMTGEIIDPMTGYDNQNVVCRHFGAYFLPHPTKCRSYFLCAYGHMHEHSCGSGAMWNFRKQQCEISVEAECYAKTLEEDKEIASSIPSTTTDNPLMVCYTLATATSDGQTTNTFQPTAATGSSSTTEMNISTWTLSTTTAEPSSSTTKSTTVATSSKSPNSSTPILLVCPNKSQSYISHPRDCNKYYMCILGMPVLTSCPVGLFWDGQMEYCDLPRNVKCFQ